MYIRAWKPDGTMLHPDHIEIYEGDDPNGNDGSRYIRVQAAQIPYLITALQAVQDYQETSPYKSFKVGE